MAGKALITGAGHRLGAAMARELAGRGWDVALHYASSREGAEAVANFFLRLARIAPPGSAGSFAWVNGQVALVTYEDGEVTTVYVPVIEDGRITTFYALRNPDKLRSLPRQDEAPGVFPLA